MRRDSLLRVGYAVALLLVVGPVLDTITRIWPMRPGDEGWRFGTLGILFNTMVTPLLGVFLAMVIAAVLEHGRTLRVIAGITLLAALGSLAAVGLFALDYLQLRANVTAEAIGGFDVASRKAILMGLLGGLVTIALGITGWQVAGRRAERRRSAVNVGLVIPQEEKA